MNCQILRRRPGDGRPAIATQGTGALIIVLWNVLILHARSGGMVRERGLANLAIFGNSVTTWSFFGTNMLGVGLHSYGFMDEERVALITFVASQLALIALGSVPVRFWQSFKSEREPVGPREQVVARVMSGEA